jgi:predicted RNA-binding Zn-ribbon protein involved in translation (DUF1610 family)
MNAKISTEEWARKWFEGDQRCPECGAHEIDCTDIDTRDEGQSLRYVCEKCDHHWSAWVAMIDDSVCPDIEIDGDPRNWIDNTRDERLLGREAFALLRELVSLADRQLDILDASTARGFDRARELLARVEGK